MDIHNRFIESYKKLEDDMHPIEYYTKKLVSSLYEIGMVSNTLSPIPLPLYDDSADLENIIKALDILKEDIRGMLYIPQSPYDYGAIEDQITFILETKERHIKASHQDALNFILEGIQNNSWMYWIDDKLKEYGLPNTETIFTIYNINPHKS